VILQLAELRCPARNCPSASTALLLLFGAQRFQAGLLRLLDLQRCTSARARRFGEFAQRTEAMVVARIC
jgi:hypothetical protein